MSWNPSLWSGVSDESWNPSLWIEVPDNLNCTSGLWSGICDMGVEALVTVLVLVCFFMGPDPGITCAGLTVNLCFRDGGLGAGPPVTAGEITVCGGAWKSSSCDILHTPESPITKPVSDPTGDPVGKKLALCDKDDCNSTAVPLSTLVGGVNSPDFLWLSFSIDKFKLLRFSTECLSRPDFWELESTGLPRTWGLSVFGEDILI